MNESNPQKQNISGLKKVVAGAALAAGSVLGLGHHAEAHEQPTPPPAAAEESGATGDEVISAIGPIEAPAMSTNANEASDGPSQVISDETPTTESTTTLPEETTTTIETPATTPATIGEPLGPETPATINGTYGPVIRSSSAETRSDQSLPKTGFPTEEVAAAGAAAIAAGAAANQAAKRVAGETAKPQQ